MSHEHETPPEIFANFLAALAKAAPRDLSHEALIAWTDNGEELARVLRGALIEGPQVSSRPAESNHADICIHFELGGQRFEAVGFLGKDEDYILGEEAIQRVDNSHIIRSDEDWRFIYQNRQNIPSELHGFWLVTARPDPDVPRNVSCLARYVGEWYGHWNYLDGRWVRDGLVLRRRVS